MIIEKLEKLDKSQRIKIAVLVVVAMGWLSYYVITRGSAIKLNRAEAKYTDTRNEFADMKNQLTGLSTLEERLAELQNQFEQQRQKWFSRHQALQFFENINAMSLAHNLRPISRIISEPEILFDNDKNDEDAGPQNHLLRIQSTRVTVTGNYFDIVDFVGDLTLPDRAQKVSIRNIHIALAPGDDFYPRASFNVVLLVDLSQEAQI